MSRNLYLSLGDSIACGVGANQRDNGYTQQLARTLSEQSLCTEFQSVAGLTWTSQNLLRSARNLPQDVWDRTHILTLLIGGNDLRRHYYSILSHPMPSQAISRAVENCTHTVTNIFDVIAEHNIPAVFVLTLYNPLPNSQSATNAIMKLNEALAGAANKRGFHLVDLYSLFLNNEPQWIDRYRTGQLQDLCTPFGRPIHPNEYGHQAIAQAVQHCLESLLTTKDEPAIRPAPTNIGV